MNSGCICVLSSKIIGVRMMLGVPNTRVKTTIGLFFMCFVLNLYTNVQNQTVLIVLISNLNKIVQKESKRNGCTLLWFYFPTFVHNTN